MNFARKHKFFIITIFILLTAFAGVVGCPRQPKKTTNRQPTDRSRGTGMNEQVFSQVLDSLNHLENHFGQGSLTQMLERLNGWIAEQSPDPAWQEDAFYAEQEKSLTALAESFSQFAQSLEKIIGGDPQSDSALTPDDVQNAADLAKTLLDRLTAAYQVLEVRHFLEFLQNVREIEGILRPYATVAKSRNLSEDDIRRFFQGQLQQFGGNPMQLVLYFRNLSETFSHFAETFRGSDLNFRRLDGDYLKQTFWCRSVSLWACGSRQDEIERVKELFDWTVRNLMMQTIIRTPQNEIVPATPQMPWEALLFGKGSVSDWACVFVELLRQHRIDACLFLSNIQDAQGQVAKSPWGVGVLLDGKVHVFLMRYGLPLVTEDEIMLDPEKGLVFGKVVTFDQLRANPGLLTACLGDNYSVELVSTLLEQTTMAVPANPIARSQRMMILEKALTGANKTVLFTSWSDLKQRFEDALPGATVTRWNYPFEADFQSCLTRGTQDIRLELFRLAPNPDYPNPLWKGRVLYLSGRKTGAEAASGQLQHACISDRELLAMMDRQAAAMSEPMTQLEVQIRETETALQGASEKDRPELETQLQNLQQIRQEYTAGMEMNFGGLQLQSVLFEIAVGTANYWLGQIHFEEALQATNANSRKSSLSAAYDYVNKRVVNNIKAQQWRHGANYHLGRVCEMQGKYEEAIRYYSTPSQEPDSIGRLFRAKQLQRLAVKE
ncbi:MAG: hypothetical protein FWH27_02225 [Planctomycetaceae bacterium]|nr:hypothetical protein [Planctomycetaceae bacterium]